MKTRIAFLLLAVIAIAPVVAQAQVLNFEGVVTTSAPTPFLNGFYNGGTSSAATSGVNYGVTFSSNMQALCLNTLSRECSNTSRGGLGDAASQGSGAFFESDTKGFITMSGGFSTGVSFFYANPLNRSPIVRVYDGVDGTGSLLAGILLAGTPSGLGVDGCPGYKANYCPFMPATLAFAGMGKSVVFLIDGNRFAYDDFTFGSLKPGAQGETPSGGDTGTPGGGGTGTVVPEPSTYALMAAGLAALGFAARRRKIA